MDTKIDLFECRNVKKQKGDFILDGIDFSLESGYVSGVIGRNGAGKTTLSRLIMGSYSRDCGEIFLNGISIDDEKLYKKQIAYVLNETPFPVSMTPKECGMLYGPYYDFDYENYYKLINDFCIPFKKKIKTFSKGQKIRHQLAFSLSYNASLYIFDEPAASLDIEFRDEFYKIIRRITEKGNKSVIYVSHLVDELERIADYILWISKGTQKYYGTVDNLKEYYRLIEVSGEEACHIPDLEIVGSRNRKMHQEILVKSNKMDLPENIRQYSRFATLKEIMYYEEKGDKTDETDI